MPKKSNTKRADGRIAVQVYLGKENGKRKYKTVYGATQKEADKKAEELKIKLHKGIDIQDENIVFSTWIKKWFEVKKNDIRASQINSYKSYIKHIENYIGNISLKDIKIYDVQRIITELATFNPNTGKPMAKKTLTDIKNTISQVFRFAIENRVTDFNPAEYIKIPKSAAKEERRALNPEERSWIINTEHRMQTAAMIMMLAGLRRGELIPLQWSDIDLEKGTISVNKAVEFVSGKPNIKTTKTSSGIRTVYIPDILIKYLTNIKKDNSLVCPSLSGDMYTASSWKSSWNSYLFDLDVLYGKLPQKKSKYNPQFHGISIDKITPHMLRHTFCTMMYENGVDIMTAKQQMGHSDIKTTLEIYTHISEDHTAEEMQKMNNLNMQVKCKS